mgnify:FL=1
MSGGYAFAVDCSPALESYTVAIDSYTVADVAVPAFELSLREVAFEAGTGAPLLQFLVLRLLLSTVGMLFLLLLMLFEFLRLGLEGIPSWSKHLRLSSLPK